MQVSLEHWQKKLSLHFRELADNREGLGLPLFAIEHGLNDDEVEQVEELLRICLSERKCIETYWLLWIVYATEIGYRYTGDEYWHSFQEKMPGWEFHDRYALRRWFERFQQSYHGFEPSGPWAKHFKIIAWPITHAILPQYLQYQFASTLYQQRYSLAAVTTLNSSSLGRLLASLAYDVTARFEKFLQQEELTGRIVLGLLGQVPEGGHEPIYSKTLERIVADLDDVRNTRNWIRDTRQTVVDRFKGIGRGTGPVVRQTPVVGGDKPLDAFTQPDIRPNLFLRYSGSGKWAVAVEIPNFVSLAAIRSDLRDFLKRTRCRVSGATDTKPAGWTVSGKRRSILKSWPDPNKPLLAFELPHDILEPLLQSDCRISSGPSWLFRIGVDGRARQIRGHNVRPGASYIFVSSEEQSAASEFVSHCTLECEGIYAVQFSVPQSLSAEDTSHLKALGLEVARTIRVWPAGLPCRGWDGEGQSEWLTTEYPQLGIVHDHPVESYLVCLDDSTQTEIDAPDSGDPVFIQVDPLRAGTHRIVVTANRQSFSDDETLSGYLELKVREPEPWIPGVPAHTGLVVGLDPYDANLDEFWANKLDLSISGPASHAVACFVSLENSAGKQILSEQVDGMFQLPVLSETWRTKFANVVKREENEWGYLEASSGKLEICGGELGHCLLRFERDSLPIRWITRQDSRKVLLRLIDDTGLEDSAPEVRYFSMENPVRAETLEFACVFEGLNPENPGGLYVAQHGSHRDALVVSFGVAGEGLQGLVSNPDVSDVLSGDVSVADMLRFLGLWSSARLVGVLPEIRRKLVVTRLQSAIYERLCGKNWAQDEITVQKNVGNSQAHDNLLNGVSRNKRFNAALQENINLIHAPIGESVKRYTELARHHGVCRDPDLCEFAVLLACEPSVLLDKYSDDLDQLSKTFASNPDVLRGARWAKIVVHSG